MTWRITSNMEGPAVQAMIRKLVEKHVAVTSTLAVFEITVPNRPAIAKVARSRVVLSGPALTSYFARRAALAESNDPDELTRFKKEMQFERDFVKAGGLLMSGNRSDLVRRRAAGLRRSAQSRTFGGGRLHAGGSHSHRHPRTARSISARTARSVPLRRARRRIWWCSRATRPSVSMTSRRCNSCSKMD